MWGRHGRGRMVVWIYNYLCNQCLPPLTLWVQILLRRGVLDTTLGDKVCHCLATGRCFSPGTPVSSTNKTDHHEITDILLKVALNNTVLTKAQLVRLAHVSYTATVFKVRFIHESSLLRVLFTQVSLYIKNDWLNWRERMSEGCLTPCEQLFRHIMARKSHYWWNFTWPLKLHLTHIHVRALRTNQSLSLMLLFSKQTYFFHFYMLKTEYQNSTQWDNIWCNGTW